MLSGLAIGLKVWGDYLSGQTQAAKYTYDADVQNKLASIASTNAVWDLRSGEVKAQQAGLQSAATMGRIASRAGAGNIAQTGSTGQVLRSQAAIGAENQAVLRADAAHAAYGEQVHAAEYTAQAGLDIYAAKTSQEATRIQMASDIVGGISETIGKGYSAAQYSPTTAGQQGSVSPKWYGGDPNAFLYG